MQLVSAVSCFVQPSGLGHWRLEVTTWSVLLICLSSITKTTYFKSPLTCLREHRIQTLEIVQVEATTWVTVVQFPDVIGWAQILREQRFKGTLLVDGKL